MKRVVGVLVVTVLLGRAENALPQERPVLIYLPPDTLASDVGAGGFVVTANRQSSPGGQYWMPTGGAVDIGGTATDAISRDGKTIVGRAFDSNGFENAAIWQGGRAWRPLGSFTPNAQPCDRLLSGAFGASDDAKVIVGLGWNGCSIAHAFRWEESTGMVDLGSTVAGRSSRADNVSGDGRVVVGWQEHPTGFRMGAKWVDGVQELIRGPNVGSWPGVVGEANAANRDGSLIVGGNCTPDIPQPSAAWTWTATAGVKCFPVERPRGIPIEFYQTTMLATSDDGRVIGGSFSFGLESQSLIWLDGQPYFLKDYLRANGVPDAFEGWVNTGFVTGVTSDGRVLVGYGAGTRAFQGFMVILPELEKE
jgi:probable HAF family extracellular repeat protein